MNPKLVDGVLWVPRRAEIPGVIGDYMAPIDTSDPEYDEWMTELEPDDPWSGTPPLSDWAEVDAVTAAGFDESKHPRQPGGTERGGQWRSTLETESSDFLREVGVHDDDAAAMARTLLSERGEPEATTEQRWAQADRLQQEEASMLKEAWSEGGENDFYSDPWRFWADKQWSDGGNATLPPDWAKGWTWGEDALEVDRAIYVHPPLDTDIAVWRGAYGQSDEPSSRPIATSFSKYVATNYADRAGTGKTEHVHRVLVPAGAHVGWDPGESEIVLPTGTILESAGPNLWVARVPEQMVDPEVLRAAGWDESKHPRDPGGEAGGEFVEAGGVDEGPALGLGRPGLEEELRAKNAVPELVEQQMEADLKDFLDSADLQMRVPESALEEALKDGEFLNQHQAQGSRGMGRSVEGEARMFGLDTTNPADLPKYGYLGPDTDGVTDYGPIKVVFKDNVKDRATFTVNDSLLMGSDVIPSPVRDPSYLSANLAQVEEVAAGAWNEPLDSTSGEMATNLRYGGEEFYADGEMWHDALAFERTSIPYVEAQIYGKLTPADIARVEVLDEQDWDLESPLTGLPLVSDRATMERVLDQLAARGIEISYYQPAGDYSGEWA